MLVFRCFFQDRAQRTRNQDLALKKAYLSHAIFHTDRDFQGSLHLQEKLLH